MKKSEILWGLIFIAIGVVLTLNALDITHISIFFEGWWTLIFIIPSIISMIERGIKFSNVFFLLLGIGFLVAEQGIISYCLLKKLIMSVTFILIGISIVGKSLFGNKIKDEIQRIDRNDKEHFTAFGSQEYNYAGEKYLGCNVDTVFGNAIINLSDVKISSDTVLKASTLFGKTLIRVPKNVNVKISKTSIFGGVDDKRENKTKDSKYTLYIEAFTIFGGLDIND